MNVPLEKEKNSPTSVNSGFLFRMLWAFQDRIVRYLRGLGI